MTIFLINTSFKFLHDNLKQILKLILKIRLLQKENGVHALRICTLPLSLYEGDSNLVCFLTKMVHTKFGGQVPAQHTIQNAKTVTSNQETRSARH